MLKLSKYILRIEYHQIILYKLNTKSYNPDENVVTEIE